MSKRLLLPVLLILFSLPVISQFTTSPQSLEKHVHYLASDQLLGRGFGTPQGKIAAEYIAQQFKDAGVEPYMGTYFHHFNSRKGILNIPGTNVVGIIPGTHPELKEEYIVLGAHYDHLGWAARKNDTIVWNGADDNASGTAAVIEVGRNLAASQESLGRSVIVVAFDGEESGLLGSHQILDDAVLPPHKVKLMFSLDMVGMYKAHGGLDMKGVKLLHDSDFLTGELASKYQITITKATKSIEQRTDTAPFGAKNIPAIAPNTGSESPYHQPEDTAAALDFEGMALISNYLSDATILLSKKEHLSDMTGLAEGEEMPPKIFSAGIRLNTGTSRFNYRDQAFKGKSIFATQIGVFTSFRMWEHVYWMPEFLYETKGSQHYMNDVRTHAFTMPWSLALSTSDEGYVRLWVQAGAYYSYQFAGKQGDNEINFTDAYHQHEYGLCYGIGMEAMNMLQMGFYFQHGLSNLHRLPSQNMVHENIYFSLGWLF